MSDAFFTLHSDVPREGPGDAASLHWAMELAGVKSDARILDAGCGQWADAALNAVLDGQAAENTLWRAHRDEFGHALAVVRPR